MAEHDDDPRPVWTWTNDLPRPTSIRVEPSFTRELGVVFVGIGERDPGTGAWKAGRPDAPSHHGIWLDKTTALALIRAVEETAEWSLREARDG